MEDAIRQDIRRLLRTFGVKADEEITAHVARNPGVSPLRVRVVLEDITDYGDAAPEGLLKLIIEEEIHASG